MANQEVSVETLDEMFKRGLDIHDSLESSAEPVNSPEFQHKVKKGILLLEDSTRLVSVLDIFSRNETVSEVPSEHLKFFLLPVLLGNLNVKLTDQDRLEVIKIVETYYHDFLSRVRDYSIASVPNLKKKDEDSSPKNANQNPNLAKMNREREEKIRRYKETKEIEASLKALKLVIEKPSCDEGVTREYYLKLIRKFVYFAIDEITSFETEKEILEHMAKMRETGGASNVLARHDKPKRPFKPIIITRDAIQKEVFGMGYKNLPVMSIEEFYEQRVRDGWFPSQAARPSTNLQDIATDADQAQLREEQEAADQEAKEENDDPEELARKRNFDEYKDDHQRGEGNRHNRG